MPQFLQILGVILLSVALKSCWHPALRKLGSLMVLLASFLIGYHLTAHWETGLFCALSWFFLPWLELLTRVRRMRLSLDHPLTRRFPPSRDHFPMLPELSAELEDAGFDRVADTGWEWEGQSQFIRLFGKPDEAVRAAITLVEQDDFLFFYVSFTSRGTDGTLWTTWNYPFSDSMKLPPVVRLNRVRGEETVAGLLERHRQFLQREAVSREQLSPVDPETLETETERELNAQIAHNVRIGVFLPADEGKVRYSWRGLLFIWCQFLRDFVRLS